MNSASFGTGINVPGVSYSANNDVLNLQFELPPSVTTTNPGDTFVEANNGAGGRPWWWMSA